MCCITHSEQNKWGIICSGLLQPFGEQCHAIDICSISNALYFLSRWIMWYFTTITGKCIPIVTILVALCPDSKIQNPESGQWRSSFIVTLECHVLKATGISESSKLWEALRVVVTEKDVGLHGMYVHSIEAWLFQGLGRLHTSEKPLHNGWHVGSLLE